MRMPDVNLLIYAHRRDEATHARYRDWLDDLVNSPEPFALSVLVAVGFLRIVTNRSIFPEPTPLPLALATIETLMARSNCRTVAPGERHWSLVSQLCSASGASGKLVADAQHAAVAIEHGCELVSRDTDFERFTELGLRFCPLILSPS
jgi:toxin-antitoxin system PIN domain toxin